jgi:hypothetical protein
MIKEKTKDKNKTKKRKSFFRSLFKRNELIISPPSKYYKLKITCL